MPTHHWGQEDFDWKGLDDAIDIIYSTCIKYGRLGGYIKEKWGCIDFYVQFFDNSLHSLIYPGHAFIRFNQWFYWNIDRFIFMKIMKYSGLGWIIRRWQQYVFNMAHQKAINKYPHLKDEILCNCFYPNLVKGAQEIHDKYWITYEHK